MREWGRLYRIAPVRARGLTVLDIPHFFRRPVSARSPPCSGHGGGDRGWNGRDSRNDDAEVEFLIENDDGVVPVEVKASAGRSRSLDRLLAGASVPYGIKLTGGNVGVADKKVTLPHYMSMFL